MGIFDWFNPVKIVDSALRVGKAIAKGVKWVAQKIEDGIDYLTDQGIYNPKKNGDPNAKFIATLTEIRDNLQSDIEKTQQEGIVEIRSSFVELFNKLREQFDNMDISRLESMLDDTIADNQAKVDEIIKDEVSVDNDELREIAKSESKEERKGKYKRYFKSLVSKIERQQRKNIRKLYNETLNNAHDAYDEENEKKRSIIDKQIKDISRMIVSNNNQDETEDILIDNIQKKIICQMAIDAVESVN